MIGSVIRLTVVWLVLLAIAGAEYLVSTVNMPLGVRPVILVFAVTMVVLIAIFFMHLLRAPMIAKGFAVAGVFWLIVLLGLGMMDPLTRHLWWVQNYSPS